MKVCSVCNEIVAADQGCVRSDCPNQIQAATGPAPKVDPGFTGKADRFVQVGLDGAGDVARETTRRAFFVIASIVIVTVTTALLFFNDWGSTSASEQIEVTVVGKANVRDAPSSTDSTILETLMKGAQLKGKWVNGSLDREEKWLELEGGNRFVWSGNLEQTPSETLNAAPNAMAFAGKYPYEKIGGYGILDAPDLRAAVKAMPNGDAVWEQIISENAALEVESPIEIIQPSRSRGIVIHKCEAHNCGGAGSRQLHIEYFPSTISEDRVVFVCLLRDYRLRSYDSYGNSSMYGTECVTGGFDYGD